MAQTEDSPENVANHSDGVAWYEDPEKLRQVAELVLVSPIDIMLHPEYAGYAPGSHISPLQAVAAAHVLEKDRQGNK